MFGAVAECFQGPFPCENCSVQRVLLDADAADRVALAKTIISVVNCRRLVTTLRRNTCARNRRTTSVMPRPSRRRCNAQLCGLLPPRLSISSTCRPCTACVSGWSASAPPLSIRYRSRQIVGSTFQLRPFRIRTLFYCSDRIAMLPMVAYPANFYQPSGIEGIGRDKCGSSQKR
jgi:hypothetical protein